MKRIILPLSLLLIGCAKDNPSTPTIIDITVSDYYSGRPLKDFKATLTKQRLSLMAPIELVDSFKTDSNGKIYYSFQSVGGYAYNFGGSVNKDYASCGGLNIITGKTNTGNFKSKGWNYLKLKIKNKTQFYQSISVRFDDEVNYTSGGGGGVYEGLPKDTTFVFKSVPEGHFKLIYTFFKGKLHASDYDQRDTLLVIQKVDTTYISLVY